MRNLHKYRSISLVFFGLTLVLALFFVLEILFVSNPKRIEKRVQRVVGELQHSVSSVTSNDAKSSDLVNREFGLYIFSDDSLVYWNQNTVSPRLLKRRTVLGQDTICNLLSGDYFVHSFTEGNRSFYLFKCLNTNYKIDNDFFPSEFCLFNTLFDLNVDFTSEESAYRIYSSNGNILSYCDFTVFKTIKSPYKEFFFALFALFLLCGLVFLFLSFDKSQQWFDSIKKKERPHFAEISLSLVFLIAVFHTYLRFQSESKKENAYMIAAAEKLMQKQDVDFEDSYFSFKQKVESDSVLREMVFSESNVLSDVVLGYSKELLFDDKMKAYSVSLTVCEPNEEITIQPEGYTVNCDNYFLDILANNETKRVGDNLYFLDYFTLDPNYLAKIKLYDLDSLRQKTLFFEFYKPIAPEGFGFPHFLQENNSNMPYDYSVASYRDSILVYKYGEFVYPNFINDLKISDKKFSFDKGVKHYALANGENDVLVVSTEKKGWADVTAPFGLFFLILLVPVVIVYFMIRPRKQREWQRKSLGNKFQMVVLLTLGISFFVLGPISVIYMRGLYNQKTKDSQFETTRTVLLEMENDIDFAWLATENRRAVWTEILQRYSRTYFTDLNLYGLDGKLIASTRPELFENFLQATLMNAESFRNLRGNRSLYYTHEETLGKGKYESAYVPITDERGNALAYLNTPYFSSELDLRSEIISFMLTYLNIILVLLSVSFLLILRVTRRLTKPLSLIQSKMQSVQLDRNNEPIDWKSNDEIGALIEQYNQLIVELEKSANLIARNERESTWREMARQVAHEIKNPLTPMQLSVQYLVKAYNDGAEDIGDRLKRTANTLLEQIDDLSEIASAFSSFAKLPENHPEMLDLASLLQGVVNLYNVEENISFTYDYDMKKEHLFNGDKTNLNRAFGNIIKNAIQAIGSKSDGKIEVELIDNEQKYIITIKDNGKGIKEENKKKIFLPNFTTKSSGTGLGLAMVYNIIQVADGRINFESEEGRGTTFIIELFKNKEQS